MDQTVAVDSVSPSSGPDRVLDRKRAEPLSDARNRVTAVESLVHLAEHLGGDFAAERALRALVRPASLTGGEELVERDGGGSCGHAHKIPLL